MPEHKYELSALDAGLDNIGGTRDERDEYYETAVEKKHRKHELLLLQEGIHDSRVNRKMRII